MKFLNRTRKVSYAKKSKRRPVKKAVKPSKSFTKAVEKIVHKNVESKQAFHGLSTTSYNSPISSVGDATRVLPSISQGTGDYQRIGDQIRGQSLVIKGAIVYNPSTGSYGTFSNARLGVRLMIVQPRKFSNLDDVQTNATSWMAYLLKKGGTTTAFNGDLSDLWAPINTDGIIKYYDKVYYLDAPYQASGVGSIQMLNSTKLFSIKMNLRNKILRYDASIGSSVQPANYAPVVILGYSHMDGTGGDTLSTAIQMTYDTIFNYEDA